MKKIKIAAALLIISTINNVSAQPDAHIKLSDAYPSAEKKITLTYNPSGTPLDGINNPAITVFYVDNKHYPTEDITLRQVGRLWTGEFTIPAVAKAFFIKISSGKTIDSNDGNGYVYKVYKNKRPVRGAYASEGYIVSSGLALAIAGIKTDINRGIWLYQKEFRLYPRTVRDPFYDRFTDNYAVILLKKQQLIQALKYEKIVYDRSNNDNLVISEHYAVALAAAARYTGAMEVATNSIKSGKTSDMLKNELKKAYTNVNGSELGYDQYLASLNDEAKKTAKQELAKQMFKQPAPLFTLTDLDGKSISLSSLKGKIVILDFWATWCNPCKAAMPGMQMLADKYKDDQEVKFLWVDCRETANNYSELVKKFMTDNQYTVDVLLDEKGGDGKQSKISSAYHVDGIPAKFVIDKEGNIRFKYVGYSGSSESLADEVTNMIDLVNKGP